MHRASRIPATRRNKLLQLNHFDDMILGHMLKQPQGDGEAGLFSMRRAFTSRYQASRNAPPRVRVLERFTGFFDQNML